MKKTIIITFSALLVGCVGVPTVKQFDAIKPDDVAINKLSNTQPYLVTSDKWWEKIGDAQLNDLIAKVLKNNDDMKIAVLNLEKAEKNIALSKSVNIPSISGDGYVQREKMSEDGLTPPPFNGMILNMSQVGLSSSYEFDLFGKYDGMIKQQVFLNTGLQLKRDYLVLTLSSQVTKLYGYWQYLQQIKQNIATQIALEQQIVAMKKSSLTLGRSVKQDLLAEKNILNNLLITKENNAQVILQTENQIRQLTGSFATQNLHNDIKIFKSLNLDVNSIKSDAVVNRPDVAYYLAMINAQKSRLQTLKADFYPSISLNGQLGLQRIDLNPFKLKDWIGSFGPAIHLPILDSGLIKSNYEIAGIDVNIFVSQYNQAVIKSFYDIDTQLHDYKQAKKILDKQHNIYNNQLDDFVLNKKQWQLNNISKLQYNEFRLQQLGNDLQYLTNQYTYFNSQINLVNAMGGVVDIQSHNGKN